MRLSKSCSRRERDPQENRCLFNWTCVIQKVVSAFKHHRCIINRWRLFLMMSTYIWVWTLISIWLPRLQHVWYTWSLLAQIRLVFFLQDTHCRNIQRIILCKLCTARTGIRLHNGFDFFGKLSSHNDASISSSATGTNRQAQACDYITWSKVIAFFFLTNANIPVLLLNHNTMSVSMFANALRTQSRIRVLTAARVALPATRSISSLVAFRTAVPKNVSLSASRLFTTSQVAHYDSEHNASRNPPSTTVFVANIPWNTTEEDLKEVFTEFGDVLAVRIRALFFLVLFFFRQRFSYDIPSRHELGWSSTRNCSYWFRQSRKCCRYCKFGDTRAYPFGRPRLAHRLCRWRTGATTGRRRAGRETLLLRFGRWRVWNQDCIPTIRWWYRRYPPVYVVYPLPLCANSLTWSNDQ